MRVIIQTYLKGFQPILGTDPHCTDWLDKPWNDQIVIVFPLFSNNETMTSRSKLHRSFDSQIDGPS